MLLANYLQIGHRAGMKSIRFLFAALSALNLLPLPAAAGIKVASFSTILTEIAQRVGGDKVDVNGLVKAGVDPHEFEPSPEDVKAVARAQLVLACGKGLEGYLTKLKESAPQAVFVEAGASPPCRRPEHH